MSNIKTIFNKNNKKKEVQDDTKVVVTVKRELGGIIPKTIAKFIAIQRRDVYMNLIIENQKYNFKEDIEIVKDRILDQLNYRLDMAGKSKEERIEIIKQNIEKQEKLLKDIKDGKVKKTNKPVTAEELMKDPEKNIRRVNTVDEENKLLQYKALLFETQNENGKGSYEGLDENGQREMMFTYKEGVFYPIFYNASNCSLHPALGTKKKIYKSEQDLIDKDREDEKSGGFKGWFGIFSKALIVILILVNVYWANQNFKNTENIDSKISQYRDMAENSALKCAYFYSKSIQSDLNIIEYAESILKSEAEQSQKSEQQIINRIRKLE
jgi:hypothetical protein